MLNSSLCKLSVLCVSVVITLSVTATQKSVLNPTIFGAGVISTRDYESSITFTPDGNVAYFVKASPDLSLRVIVESHLEKGKWTTPEVAPFSGQYMDADPCFSPDGTKLYFASRRPVEGATPKVDFDLWMVEKTGSAWSEPRHLDAPVNAASQETSPSVTKDGTLYFSSNRPGGKGGADVYRARFVDGKYSTPENVGDAINSPGPEVQVFVTPEDDILVFATAGRLDGEGSVDLYISRRVDGAWSKAVNLRKPINSQVIDSAPRISADRRYLFWTSTRGYGLEDWQTHHLNYKELSTRLDGAGNGLGDIYQIDLSELPGMR